MFKIKKPSNRTKRAFIICLIVGAVYGAITSQFLDISTILGRMIALSFLSMVPAVVITVINMLFNKGRWSHSPD